MKKQVSVILFLILIVVPFSSCVGNCVVCLLVSVYPQKEDGSAFVKEELNTFLITNAGGEQGKDVGRVFVDEKTKGAYILMRYNLGMAHYDWSCKKLKTSYKDKIQKKHFSFRIEDRAEKYEPFDMDSLTTDYTIVDESVPHIKYTVTLKKKK